MATPVVTACLITYNQARFIRQSLDGILQQQTEYPWELIVADDCSTDGTRDILQDYLSKHPDRIRLILRDKNVGASRNWFELITTPQSKYIALCEGDDYWTDPTKLQQQVSFLENNPDYSACFHGVEVVDGEGRKLGKQKNSFIHNRDVSAAEMMMGRVLSTLSLCYRNVIREFPEEYHKSPTGDNFLCSLLGNYGKGKFLPGIKPSAYRMHSAGTWSLKAGDHKRMTLLQSYFWLWQYYQRTGRRDVAEAFYRRVLLEGFYSDPFRDVVPGYLGKPELFLIRGVRKFFRLLRHFLWKPREEFDRPGVDE